MAVCDPVERSTLLTNFLTLPGTVVDNLRTIVVGPDYAVRKHDQSASEGLVGAYDESVGTTAAWPDLQADETVDLTTVQVFILDALVRYFTENASPPTVANGQQSGTTVNAIVHDGGSTVWTGTSRTLALNADVAVGDYVKLDDESGNVLETRVSGFEYVGGLPTILLLEDSLPAALQGGTFFNVDLAQVVDSIELDSADTTLTSTTVQADAGITASTTRTGTAYPVVSGQSFSGTDFSVVYTDYRALRTTNTGTILRVDSQDDLDSLFVGWQYPESELGFALARALAPQQDPAVDLPDVLAGALDGLTDTDWSNMFSRIKRRRDWYTLAALTTTDSVHQLVSTLVSDRRTLGLPSRAFFSLDRTLEQTLFSGSLAVTISGAGSDEVSVASGQPFLDAVAGDVITLDNGDYVIETRTSAQQVTVTSSAAGATTLTAVTHPLSVAEQADDYGQRAQAFADRGISVTFPDQPVWNDQTVSGYLLAAAAAGLRGYTAPQQSLRGTLMESGWEVPQSAFEFLGELEDIAAYGTFVFEDCESDPGNAVVGWTQTTDQSSTVDAYEGLVANADAVERYFKDVLTCFEGRNKITVNTLNDIQQTASTELEYLRANTIIQPFGAVLVSGTVGQVVQDSNDLVKVVVPLDVDIAAELHNLTTNLSVEIAVTS